jgi:hypothetical protein
VVKSFKDLRKNDGARMPAALICVPPLLTVFPPYPIEAVSRKDLIRRFAQMTQISA